MTSTSCCMCHEVMNGVQGRWEERALCGSLDMSSGAVDSVMKKPSVQEEKTWPPSLDDSIGHTAERAAMVGWEIESIQCLPKRNES